MLRRLFHYRGHPFTFRRFFARWFAIAAGFAVDRSDRVACFLAQAGDPLFRIGQLEEQVRNLNGRIEELGFQLLQMQEQMRQMQEDNEFRFQELEKTGGQRSDAGSGVTQPGIEPSTTASTTQGGQGAGAPPTDLGSLQVDPNGDLIGGIIEPLQPGGQTASLNSPDDLYQAGYNHMLTGDYASGRAGVCRLHCGLSGRRAGRRCDVLAGRSAIFARPLPGIGKDLSRCPQTASAGRQGRRFPAETRMSLAKLDNRETACATLREVLIRYPGASAAVRAKVSEEQQLASC
jgi:TolA-binding protein